MKILIFLTILIISSLLISNCYINALTLSKRIGNKGYDWIIVSKSSDEESIVYNFTITGTNLYEFKIDRVDKDTMSNDLYLNITTTNPKQYTYINKYFSTNEIADASSDPNGKPSFCPAWFGSCGSEQSFFSIGLNNTITYKGIRNYPSVPMTIYVTVRDVKTLC
ncbi:hypothetical protein ACTFIZ_002487 [Dictyostelium cf. discoideum]